MTRPFGNAGPTPRDVIAEFEVHVVQHLPLFFYTPSDLRRFVDEVVRHVRRNPR